ncbi:SMP-30/gluconolactonase/LRE family protein (plasmid) [Lichenicola cladoniae]|uniref:SMP-30/gluconolactonase/LRE family protein n=1 Tax=Lichenicola cladoniae TaxID=1484109 RepID=A0A6M8I032_9PROT|nr:SMP-30/gluconolactonase/LRE family protein [Lichenicola cladoniae]NPD69652.1 SMP-30/gluconolactonase/LRE family protein [Acetobacteraceae bacterium]QKE93972.1 SMP-30/gluconolactonase/LRE family protein [Lichenicola cladoniae]
MSDEVIELAVDAGATIGESPTWSASEAALYWIDVKKPALYRYHPESGAQRAWPLPSDIGAFVLDDDLSGAVVALRTGVFALDFASGRLTLLAPPPFDPALHRFNEGACDVTGRFWVGVMFDPLQPGVCVPIAASLHSFTRAGGLKPEPDAAELHNGMAWSADSRQFLLSHSQAGVIWSFDFEPESGRLSHRRTFAAIPKGDGLPDGAAVDTDGGYWCALHGAGRLRRFNKDGSIDCDIVLPVSQPTMCAFAGPKLDTLYVTSAADKLSDAQRRAEPHAGGLLRLRPSRTGVPRRCTLASA